jgi:hypothetical protein
MLPPKPRPSDEPGKVETVECIVIMANPLWDGQPSRTPLSCLCHGTWHFVWGSPKVYITYFTFGETRSCNFAYCLWLSHWRNVTSGVPANPMMLNPNSGVFQADSSHSECIFGFTCVVLGDKVCTHVYTQYIFNTSLITLANMGSVTLWHTLWIQHTGGVST